MKNKDARSLSSEAQEDLRRRVVNAVEGGMKKCVAVKVFGVSKQAIIGWHKAFRAEGSKALKSKPKGRPKSSRLKPHEASLTVRLISGKCPDQIHFPFALWTREAVKQLLFERFNVSVSKWTVGRYLKKWGATNA